MKYTKEQYLNCGFYEITEEEIDYESKIVIIKKKKQCVVCREDCLSGSKMFFESCILEGIGRRNSYTCLNCLDKWIDHIGVEHCE